MTEIKTLKAQVVDLQVKLELAQREHAQDAFLTTVMEVLMTMDGRDNQPCFCEGAATNTGHTPKCLKARTLVAEANS